MRLLAVSCVALALVAGCADDDDGGDGGGDGATTTAAVDQPSSTTAEVPAGGSTTAATATAPDPLDAAEAFLRAYLPGTRPVLGEFQQGDAQSGEVPVLRPAEGGGAANLASTLLLRIVDGEWQVVAAVNPVVTIESPENGAEVDAGPLTVTGIGRGFEGTLVASVFELSGAGVEEAVGAGGAQETPAAYAIDLDLTGVAPGTELVLVVAGGTGLDGDPGEFSAVRITT